MVNSMMISQTSWMKEPLVFEEKLTEELNFPEENGGNAIENELTGVSRTNKHCLYFHATAPLNIGNAPRSSRSWSTISFLLQTSITSKDQ